jgi:TrmH family RNA methyltransferase
MTATRKTITSRDNPRLKELRDLAGDAREIQRSGRTLLDGPHLLKCFMDGGGTPRLLAVAETGAGKPEIAALIQRAGCEVLLLADALLRPLSGVQTPAGVVALIDLPRPSGPIGKGSAVFLDAVQDPGNVGAILRTALAAGIRDVVLGAGCAGAWTPRVLRAAQGAHFALSIREQADLAVLLAGFAGRSAVTVAHGGTTLYDADLTGPVAWVFGNEGAGVSPSIIATADLALRIPLAEASESLNVAAAAAICLFEEVRQKSKQGKVG